METIETLLFEQFADALNDELANAGSCLRIDRRPPPSGSGMLLINRRSQHIGWLPDHADAAIIIAIEKFITSR